jgi:oxygen-independent coproporphyrinogen-3 oxidase
LSIPSARDHIPHAAYADAVIAELALRAASLPNLPLRSIFFGGGTPSLWQPEELARVLAAIRAAFSTGDAPLEITAECNPSSFDERVARGLRAAGVNRISLGVQSLDAARLQFLGRLHDGPGALAAVRRALDTGFDHVSADLIFGLAGQSPEAAVSEAETIAELGLRHISAYSLTIEPGTQFGELARRGRLPLLGEDQVADSFSAVERALAAKGLEHYEISNYARRGSEARHNLGYWRGDAYLGLGTGAWGTVPTPTTENAERLRYRNTPAVERYLTVASAKPEQLWAESNFVAVVERLSPETRLREALMLGLRLAEGIDCSDVEARTGARVWTRERQRSREKWQNRGVLRFDGSRLQLAREHWLIADRVIGELM